MSNETKKLYSLDEGQKEAERMFEILDFARTHERRIYENQVEPFGEEARTSFEKLTQREYLQKIEKRRPHFYTLTSEGLNLFEYERKTETVSEELKNRILEKLREAIVELEIKPWELMFYIIHAIGNRQPVTAEEIIRSFQEQFSDTKGVSRPSVYRNLKRLRMKGYIEYAKRVYRGQSPYQLSEKGKEIFCMTKADATRKLRTSEEWDKALRTIFQRVDEERKQDDEALFYVMDVKLPDLDDQQLIWVLYTRGNIYELRGRLNKAESEYLRMEGICEEIKDRKGRAYALKGLGNVALKQGRIATAKQYFERCQRIAVELQDDLLLSDALNNLGYCFYMYDEIDEALQLFEKTLELADDTFRVASTLYNKGLCYARKEEFTEARKLWLRSLNLYQKLGEPVEITMIQHNLREIDRRQKREYLVENYERAKQLGTSEDIKKAYKELARFLMHDIGKRKGG